MDTIGRYRVLRQLGHGGMGHVFLAHDPTLERDVALKLLHRQTTRTGLRDEARALAALSHPGIVTVFEIGEHEGQDFIAMEYLPGRTLRDVLIAGAPRPELLAICVKVARAVGAAHRAGILHRDIKPENVVVTDGGEVKVVDFGIARRLEHEAGRSPRAVTASEVVETLRRTLPPDGAFTGMDTEVSAGTQTMFGTPAYMAPEVLLGEVSTPQSDIFSLGVVLHECLTGRRPYAATTLVEVIALTIEGPPPKLDDPLGALLDRMLARDAAERPSLDEIASALARPVTVTTRGASRSRWPIIGLLVLLAGGLAVAGWWLQRPAPVAGRAVAATELAIAIAPFSIQMATYGVEPPDSFAIADVLAHLLGAAEGARIIGTAVDTDDPQAARSVAARYLVSGSIVESGAVLRADVTIVDATTGTRVTTVKAERATLPLVLDSIAVAVLGAVAPGSDVRLDLAPNRSRAQMFYRQGAPVLESGRFTTARPYFEQAVVADPTLFEAWYALALVLAWMDAPEAQVVRATEHALELAPPGPRKELVRGIGLFLAGDYRTARTTLEPLEAITGPGAPEPRELRYYLGEANWHDGRHDAGFAYFKSALERDARFKPATVHAWQYAVARRDNEMARYYIGLAGESTDWIELALENYEQLARTGSSPRKLDAQLVLGETHSAEIEAKVRGTDLEAATLRIAIAVAGGELARARTEFA
ncbi:MAG: protein kinase, partial [Deltaproteobacteria bacterium]|nr:protein kinase [Deltaproteobacteria bacterium]